MVWDTLAVVLADVQLKSSHVQRLFPIRKTDNRLDDTSFPSSTRPACMDLDASLLISFCHARRLHG